MLDEPTNNLDLMARNVLYSAIQAWAKGLLVISHDQELLELMEQIVVLTKRQVKIYGGNYSYYQEQQVIEHRAKEQHFTDAQKKS